VSAGENATGKGRRRRESAKNQFRAQGKGKHANPLQENDRKKCKGKRRCPCAQKKKNPGPKNCSLAHGRDEGETGKTVLKNDLRGKKARPREQKAKGARKKRERTPSRSEKGVPWGGIDDLRIRKKNPAEEKGTKKEPPARGPRGEKSPLTTNKTEKAQQQRQRKKAKKGEQGETVGCA